MTDRYNGSYVNPGNTDDVLALKDPVNHDDAIRDYAAEGNCSGKLELPVFSVEAQDHPF